MSIEGADTDALDCLVDFYSISFAAWLTLARGARDSWK